VDGYRCDVAHPVFWKPKERPPLRDALLRHAQGTPRPAEQEDRGIRCSRSGLPPDKLL